MAKRLTSIRISDYTTAQLHQLSDLYETNQSDLIMLAVDRMYRDTIGGNPLRKEQENMTTYYVDEAMLGSDATPEQAKRMVELLRERGI